MTIIQVIAWITISLSYAVTTFAAPLSPTDAPNTTDTRTSNSSSCDTTLYHLALTHENNETTLHIQPKGPSKYPYVTEVTECKLWSLPSGKKLYHWGSDSSDPVNSKEKPSYHPIAELARLGKITDQDYQRAMNLEDPNENEGNADDGVYWSTDIWDSNLYGERLLISTLQQNVTMIDPKQCTPNKPSHEGLLNLRRAVGAQCLRDLGITGTAQDNSPYYLITIDERATSQLREPTFDDFLSDTGMGMGSHNVFPTEADLAQGHMGIAPHTVFEYAQVDSRYPIPANNTWLVKNAPLVNHLILGETLTQDEQTQLENQISLNTDISVFRFLTQSNRPLAIHIRNQLGLMEKLKQAILKLPEGSTVFDL